MKRRREIGPKKQKNRAGLIKFALLALAAGICGGGLAYLLHRLIGPGAEEGPTLLHQLPGMLVAVTVLVVLGLLFFGVRKYLMGTKVRDSFQKSRMKIKRP